jgi:hypothetical protein
VANDAAAIAALRAAARPRLPPSLATVLDSPIRIDARSDLGRGVDGRYVAGRISIRRALLDASADGDAATPRRDALAALVHELAHAWDRSPAGGASRDPRLLDLALSHCCLFCRSLGS